MRRGRDGAGPGGKNACEGASGAVAMGTGRASDRRETGKEGKTGRTLLEDASPLQLSWTGRNQQRHDHGRWKGVAATPVMGVD